MRIHGESIIKRRSLEINDYKEHKHELEEDFCGLCGYCGKHFKSTLSDSEIDHFIPQKKFPAYKNKYSNLVLACKVCNNKKRSDWPSEDPQKSITDDEEKGYVDPATDEYDNHLIRCEDGNIIGITKIGNYMFKRLGFAYRPISEVYKIKKIYEEIQVLREKKERNEIAFDPNVLCELFETFEDLRQNIHIKKE